MQKHFFLISLLSLSSVMLQAQELARFRQHVTILSADDMMGRDSKRPEIWKAAEYIKKQYEEIGLEAPYSGSYYQRFQIPDTRIETANVIGYIPSKVSTNESVVFIAHYDGLGVRKKADEPDSIYNGAVDNAVGVAAILELARRFKNDSSPAKNLIFIASSAEEIGSHGAKAYLSSPLFPKEQITFALNIDGFNVYGETKDVNIMPRQGISYRDHIAKLCADRGLEDNTPDWVDGMNKNFDSSVFMASGIPSITIWSGTKITRMTAEESRNYKFSIGRNHHSSKDEMSELWNWTGIKDHLDLYEALARYFLSHSMEGKVTEPALFSKEP